LVTHLDEFDPSPGGWTYSHFDVSDIKNWYPSFCTRERMNEFNQPGNYVKDEDNIQYGVKTIFYRGIPVWTREKIHERWRLSFPAEEPLW
jgi:hypothetical protein